MTASAHQRWFKLASAWLIVLAGALLVLVAQVLRRWEDLVLPALGLVEDQLNRDQAVALALDLLHGMALASPLLLFVFGTSQWILAKEADLRTLRRHALRNALLLGLSAWPIGSAGPLWLGLAFATAAGLYAFSAYAPRGRSMFSGQH
ncbi:hypothetical protein [Pseudomarimonas arenosa]|uniref:Uncharacterized protein n=1 Tax=Pseudomarimonas arenosa TaxID=2774145 RepID=A0AAW3ZLN4_9GAMM|nr:hypothetical protein [Pseudomarimonas arenosa]MBD8527040.1 hypothetical protein [Pseudomarimonas arenosa]